MGRCCVGSSGSPGDAETCTELGGDYYPDDSHNCGFQGGLCFITTVMTEQIGEETEDPMMLVATSGTFSALEELRDHVLSPSAIGRKLLEVHRKLGAGDLASISDRPRLRREVALAAIMAASFSQTILRLHWADKPKKADLGRRFTPELSRRIRRVADAVATDAQGDLLRFAQMASELAAQFEGQTAGEIHAALTKKRPTRG